MELETSIFIWVVTFLIGITMLTYRNFYSKEIREKINTGEKVGTIPLTVITLGLPFILGKLTMKTDLLEAISKLSSIGTPLIALLAYIEYKSKTANKVNEKQLDTVIELVKYIRGYRYFESTEKICYEYDDGKTDLIGIYNLTSPEDVVISYERFNDFKSELNKYVNDPVLPSPIACKIKNFLSNVKETKEYPKLGSHIEYPSFKECRDTLKYKSDGKIILKQYVGEIIMAIDDWLMENQVKNINLPKIDKESIRKKKNSYNKTEKI
ncbi:MAG: hypothetical protein RI580_08555 [Halothece sp. Uz-M2-17]|nr:hypothetical protein [Halothece sp. Uz-M2-17]